ncbi:hypothetical protein INR49_020602 [Caranx melampygus]|nr:hypothetical protein INR49_020602 [Caranx melampygus]
MLPGSGSSCSSALLLLLLLGCASCFELLPEEAAPRRARFSANSPADVARCLSGAVTVGCGFFSSKVFQTIRRCNIFQRMIAEVQEECYTSLDICTVARTNPDAIGEVVQVPAHFPNRYYSTLLQTLQACDEQTVAAVRSGLIARLGPDMETFLQLVQNKPCAAGSDSASYNNPASWRNMPVFNIQPGFRGRDPTHLFARRSVDSNGDGGVNAEK